MIRHTLVEERFVNIQVVSFFLAKKSAKHLIWSPNIALLYRHISHSHDHSRTRVSFDKYC